MGRLPRELEEKRERLIRAAERGAFNNYLRYGRVPDAYSRIAKIVNEAKAFSDASSLEALRSVRPTTHYVWRTTGDDRVRSSHAARHGQVFSWSNPPPGGSPGAEPNCRCWTEPYYGDPSVPDALLQLQSERRFSTETGQLWASAETLIRPDGSPAASTIVANDGTRIDSTFVGTSVAQVVTLPDTSMLRVERDGEMRRILLATGTARPLRVAWLGRALFPRFLPPPPLTVPTAPLAVHFPEEQVPLDRVISPVAIMVRGALSLYNMLVAVPEASGASVSDVPAMAFGAWDYTSEGRTTAPILTGTLSEEQTARFCKRLPEVQAWTDEAARLYQPDRWFLGPQRFGVNVHTWVRRRVEAVKASGAGDDLWVEYSIDPNKDNDEGGYGARGTTRLDILEYRPDLGLACVYDIKTGNAGLTPRRIADIAGAVNKHFGLISFIVIEIKPDE